MDQDTLGLIGLGGRMGGLGGMGLGMNIQPGNLSIQSFTHYSFMHSLIHAYIHFIHLYTHPFIHSSIHPFIHSFIQSSIHLFMHSCIRSAYKTANPTNPCIIQFIHPNIYPSIHSSHCLGLSSAPGQSMFGAIGSDLGQSSRGFMNKAASTSQLGKGSRKNPVFF